MSGVEWNGLERIGKDRNGLDWSGVEMIGLDGKGRARHGAQRNAKAI